MNKKKLTAMITVLSCIVCLTACAGNNAGSNSSSDETNGSAIQISNKEESKTDEPAPEPSKTEEPAKDDRITGKVVGKDVYLKKYYLEDEIDAEHKAELDAVYDFAREYTKAHRNENGYFVDYQNCKYFYSEWVLHGAAKPNMKKLQLDELKEILNTYIGKDGDLKERFYETRTYDNGEVRLIDNRECRETLQKFKEALLEKQPLADAASNHSLGTLYMIYWPDANTLQERREEIVVPWQSLSSAPCLYRTFDENGDLIEETVLFDLENDIRNF